MAVVDDGDSFSQLDAEGWTFGRLAKAPDGLPLVEVGSDADRAALVEAAQVVAALDPDVSARVEAVEVRTVDQVLLRLRDGREVRWGSADRAEQKAAVLLDLLAAAPDARTYDVSVPGLPTTRP
ncbi:cell division protein FtsQ/DivIB [Nocardioides sp. TF02-7]|uniref:cell division protein FtsQ/DivIB n=1 Tax=Nocardioides sp. TF02-7 TaxID=2917724 RepID=UPI001F06CAD6|nr:cell division protein FtsQ/DivIB [Nocardioides sp. TF02-7]UMG92107.1 cell division protein FtsQ/DivIB [Nocardioides sp. TF02-7]